MGRGVRWCVNVPITGARLRSVRRVPSPTPRAPRPRAEPSTTRRTSPFRSSDACHFESAGLHRYRLLPFLRPRPVRPLPPRRPCGEDAYPHPPRAVRDRRPYNRVNVALETNIFVEKGGSGETFGSRPRGPTIHGLTRDLVSAPLGPSTVEAGAGRGVGRGVGRGTAGQWRVSDVLRRKP